ncbi:MAG: cytochrome c [Blastocatellia bacterium]
MNQTHSHQLSNEYQERLSKPVSGAAAGVTRKIAPLMLLLGALLSLAACTHPPEPKAEPASPLPGTSVEKAAVPSAKKPGSPAAVLESEPLMTEEVHTAYVRSCRECHGADGHGIAAVAPDLRVSPKRSSEDWEKYLRNPKSIDPKATKAPMRGLSDDEVKAVAAYLADLTQHNPSPEKK